MNITYECFMYKHVYTLYFNKKRKETTGNKTFFCQIFNFCEKKKSIEKPLPKVI